MIARQSTQFFLLIFELYPLVYFIFVFLRTSQINFLRSPYCIMFQSVKYIFTLLKMTLLSLLTQMSLIYRTSVNLWYITCFVPNLIPIYPNPMCLQVHNLWYITCFVPNLIPIYPSPMCLQVHNPNQPVPVQARLLFTECIFCDVDVVQIKK